MLPAAVLAHFGGSTEQGQEGVGGKGPENPAGWAT